MPSTKAQQKAVRKYKENHYDRVELVIKPKGQKAKLQSHAEARGESLNAFINRAIEAALEKEGGN